MSAKWRALQHKHQFTYSYTAFPESYVHTLDLLSAGNAYSSFSKFLTEFRNLTSLSTTYAQVASVKNLASSICEVLRDVEIPKDLVLQATRLYLRILFLENSLPLHRTLISAIAKSQKSLHVIDECFVALCKEFRSKSQMEKKWFLMSRAVLSLISYPKLSFMNDAIEKCTVSVSLDIVDGLRGVTSDTEFGSRPSPAVMEQCQEAMSCLYYLIQRFTSRFNSKENGLDVFESIFGTILSVLKSSSFSRDCLVAAGVSFWAALQVYFGLHDLTFFIAKSFFDVSEDSARSLSIHNVASWTNLYSNIATLSTLSRLCLLRGMLTAVPRSVLNTHIEGPGGKVWTILYNGILPELCNYCENPVDSHFNFHALTVTQICFQQIKTSMLSGLTNCLGDYYPLPEDITSRIIRIIWNNLDDSLSQTVRQVHLIFDLFLDIQSKALSAGDSKRNKSFLCRIASDLLCLGARSKGRHVPLAFVTKRLGAKTLLEMNPELMSQTVQAYIDDDVCCAATSFLKCFLECLRDECWISYGIDMGYESFREVCLPSILKGLIYGVSKLRSNLNTYALPSVLEVDVDSIFPMLASIFVGPNGEEKNINDMEMAVGQCIAALVSLLKVARSLALIEGDIDIEHGHSNQNNIKNNLAVVCIKGIKVRVFVEWFELALSHADESIRIDAAETLFLNPKTASLPSSLELSLMRKAIPLNMRCCSTAFQMKWSSLFRKFFCRVKTALERQVKQGSWHLVPCSALKEEFHVTDAKIIDSKRTKDLYLFMRWLSSYLFFSCYPSAPYERKTMAMELIRIILDIWPPVSHSERSVCTKPYEDGFLSPNAALLLVSSVVDSWDRLRDSSYHILLSFPTPIPGISSHDSVKEVILWAKNLVCSPRVRESDAGALTMRLIFRKYVLDLGWMIGDVFCFDPKNELPNGVSHIGNSCVPMIEYFLSLIGWLTNTIEEGEKDLSRACRNSSIHGVLLTLRYAFEELDWNSTVVLSNRSQMKHVLEKLLELIERITSLALWVVSADAWCFPNDAADVADEVDFLSEFDTSTDTVDLLDMADGSRKTDDDVGSTNQVIMVGCWLAMKEVSLLLGTIVRKVPLPAYPYMDVSIPDNYFGSADGQITTITDAMLGLNQLESIGSHFLQVLLKMKHNGAIDKTRAGFTALCNRLLSSNDQKLCKMAASWMEQLMERTIAKGQTVDDLLRRSAGIPAAFSALFLSEPEGTPKTLLPWALRWLIDVANKSMLSTSNINFQDDVLPSNKDLLVNLKVGNGQFMATGADTRLKTSKTRDEGLVPTVHAFNVLKAAFNDTNLATDTSGFCSEALIISIRSFSSPYWEVRNSACLAYTALVRRMIGFLNVHKRDSARRSLTGLEFFHRYPALHSFLLGELTIATESLSDGNNSRSNISKAIHPSLCPILILLSRLKPSLVSSGSNDAYDPFLFMPLIRKCATQSNFKVRVLASRALTGLVSNERLTGVLSEVSSSLARVSTCGASFNLIHGMLLQLSMLVEINCGDLRDTQKKVEILEDLIQVLRKCSSLGSIRACRCPTIIGSFLKVLDHMLVILRTLKTGRCTDLVQNLLSELSSECLDKDNFLGLESYDPSEVELHRQAAVSYFSCQFESYLADQETIQKKITFCLSHCTYEVRLAVLKWLMKFLKSAKPADVVDVIYLWAKRNLQPTLLKLLVMEKHWKCICYILRVIYFWNLLHLEELEHEQYQEALSFATTDFYTVFHFWNRLLSLSCTVTHSKTREALICCMGICVRHLIRYQRTSAILNKSGATASCERWTKVHTSVIDFVLIVKQHCAPSEPVSMRKAASESIIASGLLKESKFISLHVSNCEIPSDEQKDGDLENRKFSDVNPLRSINLYGCTILDMWCICIQLLEDEDTDLRQRLAGEVQKYYTSTENIGQAKFTCACPTQVEKVIESCFSFLSSIYGEWIVYFDYLSKWAINSARYHAAQGNLVRQVFDKEIDNHHEEKLLICQMCCQHLEKILELPYWSVGFPSHHIGKDDTRIYLQHWRAKFFNQLLCFTDEFLEAERKTAWIGGLGNHKDTFTSIYASLLGLYTLTQCPTVSIYLPVETSDTRAPNSSDMCKLTEILRPFLRNPIIYNLYLLVVQSYKKIIGPTASQIDVEPSREFSAWKDFDPYFLLK